jgi:hypothetical protein
LYFLLTDNHSPQQIQDLEISNRSLLLINHSLELSKSALTKEIQDLRQALKESTTDPSLLLNLKHTLHRSDEEESFDEIGEEDDEGDQSMGELLEGDDAFRRAIGVVEELVRRGKEAMESKAKIGEGKVLNSLEVEERQREREDEDRHKEEEAYLDSGEEYEDEDGEDRLGRSIGGNWSKSMEDFRRSLEEDYHEEEEIPSIEVEGSSFEKTRNFKNPRSGKPNLGNKPRRGDGPASSMGGPPKKNGQPLKQRQGTGSTITPMSKSNKVLSSSTNSNVSTNGRRPSIKSPPMSPPTKPSSRAKVPPMTLRTSNQKVIVRKTTGSTIVANSRPPSRGGTNSPSRSPSRSTTATTARPPSPSRPSSRATTIESGSRPVSRISNREFERPRSNTSATSSASPGMKLFKSSSKKDLRRSHPDGNFLRVGEE